MKGEKIKAHKYSGPCEMLLMQVWGFFYFCGFLTIPITDVLSEKRLRFFVMYHSKVILDAPSGASNSELKPK